MRKRWLANGPSIGKACSTQRYPLKARLSMFTTALLMGGCGLTPPAFAPIESTTGVGRLVVSVAWPSPTVRQVAVVSPLPPPSPACLCPGRASPCARDAACLVVRYNPKKRAILPWQNAESALLPYPPRAGMVEFI
jgi:hypothetical protein